MNFYSQNKDDLRKNTIFNYSVPQKDIIYYSFKVEPSDKSKMLSVKFYLQILNNALVFNKIDNAYESMFEIKLFLKKNNETVQRHIWVDTVSVNEYIKTNLNDYYYETTKTFELENDDYEVDVQLFDVNANKFNESNYFLKIKSNSEMQNVIGFPAIFVNNHYSVNQKTLDYNKKYGMEVIKLDQSLNIINMDISDSKKNILYRKRIQIGHAKRFEKIYIPFDFEFPEGDYSILLYHSALDTKLKLLEKEITIRWWDKPELLHEITLAYRPFELLLDETEKNSFNLLSDKEKLIYFNNFWENNSKQKRSNYFNELKYEFYKRVDHVVKKYTNDSQVGWETDIGKSHLLYGFPLEINQFYKDDNKFLLWKYSGFEILFIFNSIQKQYVQYSFKEGNS